MIYYDEKTQQFKPLRFRATFYDTGAARTDYTNDPAYWPAFAARWTHVQGVQVDRNRLTEEQHTRLDAVNEMAPQPLAGEAAIYVEHGAVMPEAERPALQALKDDPAVKAATLDHCRQRIIAGVRAERWKHEQAGVAWDGYTLRTDDHSQARVAALWSFAAGGEEESLYDFEVAPGEWIEVTGVQVHEITTAVLGHVQMCFTRCRQINEAVNSHETVESLLQAEEQGAFQWGAANG